MAQLIAVVVTVEVPQVVEVPVEELREEPVEELVEELRVQAYSLAWVGPILELVRPGLSFWAQLSRLVFRALFLMVVG